MSPNHCSTFDWQHKHPLISNCWCPSHSKHHEESSGVAKGTLFCCCFLCCDLLQVHFLFQTILLSEKEQFYQGARTRPLPIIDKKIKTCFPEAQPQKMLLVLHGPRLWIYTLNRKLTADIRVVQCAALSPRSKQVAGLIPLTGFPASVRVLSGFDRFLPQFKATLS